MGLIYKLSSVHEAQPYVGKTMGTLNDRFRRHKSDYKRWLNGKYNYVTSFELIKHNDCIMIVLEIDVPKNMLASREGYWHSQFDCVNKCVPNRSLKEWYEDNRDEILEKKNQYRQNNKEMLMQKVTCECGCVVRQADIARHRKSTKHKSMFEKKMHS